MAIDPEKIVRLLGTKGPVLPAQIAKELGVDLMIASAYLSELTDRKKLKVSHLKIGSSPLYYVPGQEAQLTQWADQLGEKDHRTYDLLQEQQVIRETDCDPLTKVSLSHLKDFAIPLNVTIEGKKELFYKWFTCSNEAAAAIINQILEPQDVVARAPPPLQQTTPIPHPQPAAPAPVAANAPPAAQPPVQAQIPQPAPVLEPNRPTQQEPIIPPPTPSEPTQKKPRKPRAKPQPAETPTLGQPEAPAATPTVLPPTHFTQTQMTTPPTQPSTLLPAAQPADRISDELFEKIKLLLGEKNITITDVSVIKKGRELNVLVEVPSVVGRLRYFAKAVHKQKSNDKDIASAFLEAERYKLPLLFLHTGEITKKAKEMTGQADFRNLMIIQLEN